MGVSTHILIARRKREAEEREAALRAERGEPQTRTELDGIENLVEMTVDLSDPDEGEDD